MAHDLAFPENPATSAAALPTVLQPGRPPDSRPEAPEWERHAARLAADGDPTEALAFLEAVLPHLLDRGEAPALLLVLERLGAVPGLLDLVRSRIHLRAGALDRALELARRALAGCATADPFTPRPDDRVATRRTLAEENLRWVATVAGDPEAIGESWPGTSLPDAGADDLVELEGRVRARLADAPPGPSALRGSLLARIAAIAAARGDPTTALETGIEAVRELGRSGSPRETALARLTVADAAVLLERDVEARDHLEEATRVAPSDPAVLSGLVDHEERHGVPGEMERHRRELERVLRERSEAGLPMVGDGFRASDGSVEPLLAIGLDPGLVLRTSARIALRAVAERAEQAPGLVASLLSLARRSGAERWVAFGRLLAGLLEDGASASDAVRRAGPAALTMAVPALVNRLDELTPEARERLEAEMRRRPERWRPYLRLALEGGPVGRTAALALVEIGTTEEIPLLAAVSRAARQRAGLERLGKRLARRVAAPILVDDLGRVGLVTPGAGRTMGVRRKVLTLLCYLITTDDLSATRDQVLDAVWPEMDPRVAANSLNQTIYFLRRAFERPYLDERSPDYVHHDAELVWLDPALVESRSRRCRALIAHARGGADRDVVDELLEAYGGRFALDFAYEPWAESYRDGLHAGYLATVESAIRRAEEDGEPDRVIALARRGIEIDPTAEPIERALLRAYRQVGAHAAAAEQYAHYAAMLRDELGVEPPPLEGV